MLGFDSNEGPTYGSALVPLVGSFLETIESHPEAHRSEIIRRLSLRFGSIASVTGTYLGESVGCPTSYLTYLMDKSIPPENWHSVPEVLQRLPQVLLKLCARLGGPERSRSPRALFVDC